MWQGFQNSGLRTSINLPDIKAMKMVAKIVNINFFRDLETKGLKQTEECLLKKRYVRIASFVALWSTLLLLCSSFENQQHCNHRSVAIIGSHAGMEIPPCLISRALSLFDLCSISLKIKHMLTVVGLLK